MRLSFKETASRGLSYARRPASERMVRLLDSASASLFADFALESSHYGSFATQPYFGANGRQLLAEVTNAWCGGSDLMAQKYFRSLYYRTLPGRWARKLLGFTVLFLAAVISRELVWGDHAWWGKTFMTLLSFLVLVTGLCITFVTPRVLLNAVRLTRDDTCLFSLKARQRFWDRNWGQLPACTFSWPALQGYIQADQLPADVFETIMVLHRDGWTGTVHELVHASKSL